MASTMKHHQKSHDEIEYTSSEDETIQGQLGLRSISFETTTSTTTPVQKQEFVALTRTNIHQKQSGAATTTTTSTTTSSDNSIKNLMSLRDFHQQDEDENSNFVGSLEIHLKHSRENFISNPDELPEVWIDTTPTDGTTTTTTATTTAAQISEVAAAPEATANDVIERVNPAPEHVGDNSFGDTFDTSNSESQEQNIDTGLVSAAPDEDPDKPPCRTKSTNGEAQKLSSFGHHSSKNPGIVLRYSYELVQDLTGIDWTINSEGNRDGSDYLMESVLPQVEEGIVGEALVPALFEECGAKRRGLRRLVSSDVVAIDMKPDDFILPQTECISNYVPKDPLKSIQCHHIEGAMTLYFPQSSAYTALLPAVTFQALSAIKTEMESGSLLSTHESVLSLKFLDSSYTLSPIMPVEVPETSSVVTTSSPPAENSNVGLTVRLVFLFLAVGFGGIVGLWWYKTRYDLDIGQVEDQDVVLEIHDVTDLKPAHQEDGDIDEEEASYTTNGSESTGDNGATTDDDTGDEGGSYSDSSDSDGVFEDDDESDPEDDNAPGYGDMYKKKKIKKTKNNIVISGVADEGSVGTGATGATGLHSEASQRTVKMKNVVLPNILDVDINMR